MLGLARVATSGTMHRRFGPDGHVLTSRQQLQNLQQWSADLEALASGAAANQSLADVLRGPAMLSRLGGSPANAALLGAEAAARYGVQYGGALGQLSALYFDNTTSYGGVDNVVLGGYSSIPESLAAELGEGGQLLLSSPVLAIHHGDSNATVYTATGEALTAQYVVCTAPLGVLQAGGIQLEPPLPNETVAAVARLGTGRLEKLWLEFGSVSAPGVCLLLMGRRGQQWDTLMPPARFRAKRLFRVRWHADFLLLRVQFHRHLQAFWSEALCGSGEAAAPCEQLGYLAAATNSSGWRRFISMAAYTGRPVLVALATAEWAEALEGMSDEEAAATALADLAALFPGAAPAAQLVQYRLSRWGQDPWARGSLSYHAGAALWGRGGGEREGGRQCRWQAACTLCLQACRWTDGLHSCCCCCCSTLVRLQWAAPPATAPRWQSRRAAAWCWRERRPQCCTLAPCTAPTCRARRRRIVCWTRRRSCRSATAPPAVQRAAATATCAWWRRPWRWWRRLRRMLPTACASGRHFWSSN